jgi:type II secretory pathway component GspD/PulD (secretin)
MYRFVSTRFRSFPAFRFTAFRFTAFRFTVAFALLTALAGAVHSQTPVVPQGSQLRTINLPRGQSASVATRLGLKYRDQQQVNISFDDREDRLIIMAPPSMQAEIANEVDALIETDSRAIANGAVNGEFTHRLRHLSWDGFEREFEKLSLAPASVTSVRSGQIAAFRMTTPPMLGSTVEVNRRSGIVHVQSNPNMISGWKKLILTLDSPASGNGQQITTVLRLKNAEPAPIQRAIRLLGNLEQTAKQKRAKENTRANSRKPSAVRTVAFQDQELPAPGSTNEGGDAAGEKESGSGVIGDTQIEFVPELGTIIIKGAKRDVQRVMDVIKEIEKQSEVTKPNVEVVQLQHADANAVAALLKQLYTDVLSARQGQVSITSLDAPNALLLIGRDEAIKSLLDLVQKIDQPLPETDRLRIFRLQHASAMDAETAIREFFSNRPGEDDDLRPGLGNRVRVLGDYRTNSLIISASPRDLEEVSRLISELDVQNISSQNQIKVFPLNNALAEDLASVIQDAITPGDDNDNAANPSASLSIVSLDTAGSRVLDSGILLGATITADASGNALVVRATSGSMPLIAELIRQLDQAPGLDSLVKVFTIENGDALQLTAALTDLFGDDAATGGTSVGAANLAGLPPTTSGSESSLVSLRFSTDQRTNSIIASGSAEDLEVVESILLRLDSEGFAERITEVIWLRHQTATDIATAIQTYVQQRTQTVNTIQQFQQGLGPFDLPDRDLIVVAEPVTNSLLLSVAPRMYEDVRRLIDRLDRRPPMVMIKVVLAEVSLGDTFEIGGEVGLQDALVYDRGVTSAALGTPSAPGFNFNDAGVPNANQFARGTIGTTGVSSLGVGANAAGVSYGGFVLSAASDSVSLLLRTLQTANRMQVLSRPQIMTLDNTEGRVQVGRTIARVTDILNNGVSGTQVVTEDLPVGLILQIRPRVGADGLIVMDIDATRSQRDPTQGTQVPVAGDLGAITIDDIIETTAQSVVAAYSGQTVIFGGLIQKERNNISRRVPILADIPLIGNFFKYDRETETRNETLIIMTPMVVTGEQDLEYVKQTESSRMSWCLADVVEMHGDVGLSGGYGLWGPAIGQTIYPDMQPTVDDIIIGDDLSIHSSPANLNYGDNSGFSIEGSQSPMLEDGFHGYGDPGTVVPGFTPHPSPPVGAPVLPPSGMPIPTHQSRSPTPAPVPSAKLASMRLPILESTKLSSPATQVSWMELIEESQDISDEALTTNQP